MFRKRLEKIASSRGHSALPNKATNLKDPETTIVGKRKPLDNVHSRESDDAHLWMDIRSCRFLAKNADDAFKTVPVYLVTLAGRAKDIQIVEAVPDRRPDFTPENVLHQLLIPSQGISQLTRIA
jgi:hypothetical protein